MNSLNESLAAIGLKARTGRAIAVVLSRSRNAPELSKRTEITLTDPRITATFQPYHEVMDLPWDESEKKVKPFVRAIEKVATKALAQLIHELRAEGLEVVGIGVAGPGRLLFGGACQHEEACKRGDQGGRTPHMC